LEGMQTTRVDERSVFVVSSRTFRWADIVCAARAWGRWAECESAARQARSALAAAEPTGAPLDGAEFSAEEERFRRSRRLLAADDLVLWLARRDVKVAAWRDYIRGVVLRRRPEPAAADHPDGDGDLGADVWVHAVCSGTLDSVAHQLAGRAAAAGAGGRLPEDAGPLSESDVAELDLIYEDFCERSATVDAIEREVERHRLDWLSFEWRSQAAGDPDVLREAALCIREDGLDFDEAAATAGLVVQRQRTSLDGAEAELRDHLLGARAGELLGPLPVGSEYWLVEVLDKRIPTTEDPAVHARAREVVVSRAVEAAVVDHVRWDERV
jgi:hypothetical protein